MKIRTFLPLAAAAAMLAGCSAPYAVETHTPPEKLGGHFQAELLTHNGTRNSVIVAVRADNDNGFLKVCGLYVYGGGGDDFGRFQKGIVDQNSFVEVGTDKDTKGVRLHARFLHAHVSAPGSLLDGFIDKPQADKPSLEKLVVNADAMHLAADCVTTQTPWRPGFAQARFVPNFVITTMTTVWIPGHR